jgi:hypothetical protein
MALKQHGGTVSWPTFDRIDIVMARQLRNQRGDLTNRLRLADDVACPSRRGHSVFSRVAPRSAVMRGRMCTCSKRTVLASH